MEALREIRIDKWLWAVRVFKTRSLAIEACHSGCVKVGGQRVKPARPVRVGDLIAVQVGELTRTLKVVAPLDRRVGASLVKNYAEDLTAPEEAARACQARQPAAGCWPKGQGRPTKRARRLLELAGAGEGALSQDHDYDPIEGRENPQL
jgi:ribosome-associated heat shock protein Hsp15